jgi:hypothetical protein
VHDKPECSYQLAVDITVNPMKINSIVEDEKSARDASMDNTTEHGCSWKMKHFFYKVINLLFMLRPVFWDSLDDLRCPSISLEPFCKTMGHFLLSFTPSTKIVTLGKTWVASKNGTTSKNEQKRNDSLRSPSSKKIRKKTSNKLQLKFISSFIKKIIPVYSTPTDDHNYNEITDDIKCLFPAIESQMADHSQFVTGFSYYSSDVLDNDYPLQTAGSAGPAVGYSCCNVVGSALITPPSHKTLVTSKQGATAPILLSL